MSFKLSTPKHLSKSISKIWIRTNDEPLFLETEKCYSYGVKRNEKLNKLSKSLILDQTTKQKLQNFITETKIELSKIFYGKTKTRST